VTVGAIIDGARLLLDDNDVCLLAHYSEQAQTTLVGWVRCEGGMRCVTAQGRLRTSREWRHRPSTLPFTIIIGCGRKTDS
jgi:hypothetical protein